MRVAWGVAAGVVALIVLLASVVTTAGAGVTAKDAFGRTVAAGWGTADQGGSWSASGGTSALSVGGGVGSMTMPAAASSRGAILGSIDERDVDWTAQVRLDKRPQGGSAYFYLVARRQGSTEYRLKMRVSSSGAVYLGATKVVSGTETSIGSEVRASGMTLKAGAFVELHGRVWQVSPTHLRLRAWAAGDQEPSSWPIDETDGTAALATSGQAGSGPTWGRAPRMDRWSSASITSS